MSDIEKLIKIQGMLSEIDKLLTPDFVDRIDDRISNIEWLNNYGNPLEYLTSDIDYWIAELNSVQQDIDDFPEDM